MYDVEADSQEDAVTGTRTVVRMVFCLGAMLVNVHVVTGSFKMAEKVSCAMLTGEVVAVYPTSLSMGCDVLTCRCS